VAGALPSNDQKPVQESRAANAKPSPGRTAEGLPDAAPNAKREREPRVQPPTRRSEVLRTALVTSILLLLSYAFRLPPLLNARSTNSDASIVGLQAMHILEGELSPFLWGSGYQTSADAFVAAVFFAVGGPTPLALMLSALTLHVIATWLVFATLRRRFSPWTAFVLTLPLVVSPASIHTYALYPPRQLGITLTVAAFWVLNGARRSRRPHAMLAIGAMLYGLALSADPYPMVLAPIVLGYALLVALDRRASADFGAVIRPLGSAALGLLAGLVPFVLLRRAAGATTGQMGLSTSVLRHNWDLLVRECLPWALSYKVYSAPNAANYRPWDAPIPIQAVQIAGAMIAGGIVVFALVASRWSSIPRSVRQLGFASAMTYPIAIAAFLVSVMVMDHFSMRYLAVLTLMLPFAAAPAAYALGRGRFAALIAPHLVASAVCGWLGYGPFVRGAVPVLDPTLPDDYALFDVLRARAIVYAEGDYWASYRLTLLFAEKIIVVPTNASEDRYAPYRRAFEAAPTFAYVFDPSRSRESLEKTEQTLRDANASVEKTNAGLHTVFIVTRR
jgi:hypothetical protein